MEAQTAVLLCGGMGTRLRPITYEIPKPMIPVQGKTLLEHNFDLLKKHNIKKAILCTGYMKDKIKAYFGSGEKFGIDISYAEEDEPLGTGGPLRLLKTMNKAPNQIFIMANCDELKDINIGSMIKVHKKNNALATIALTRIKDPSDWGVVKMDGDKIIDFVEKPKKEEAPSNLINSGLYILDPSVFEMIPNGKVSLEREIFPKLAAQGRLYGYEFYGQWFPTDNFERLEKAIKEWKGIKL